MRAAVVALQMFALLLPNLVIPLAEGSDLLSGHIHADSVWHAPELPHSQSDLNERSFPIESSSQEHSGHSHMVFFTAATAVDLNTQRALPSFDIPAGFPPRDQQRSPPQRPPRFV